MSALDFLMGRELDWPGTIRAHDFLSTVKPGIGSSRPPHAVSAAEIVDISENPTPDLYEPRVNGEPLGAGQTVRTLGNALISSVTHGLPRAWAGMVEGQDYGKTTDWTNNASFATDFQQPGMDISGEKWTPNPVIDALVNRATAHVKANQSPDDAKTGTAIPGITVQNLKNLESNAAFSLANTLGTIVNPFMGVPATFFGSQRMSSNQFLRDAEEKLSDVAQKSGSVLSDEALLEKLDQVRDLSIKNGLWEAVPETASNLLFGGILKANAVGPLKQVFRKVFGESGEQAFSKWAQHTGAKIASGAGKLGASIGEELATETMTQMGQSQTEYDANARLGFPNKEKRREWTNPKDWGKSFDEVAPDTILQSLLTFGSGSAVNRGTRLASEAAYDAAQAAAKEQAIEQFLEIASGRGDKNTQQAEVPRAEDFLREGRTQSAVPAEPASQVAPNIESAAQNQTVPTVFDNPTDALIAQVDANEATGVDHRIVENEDGTYTIAPVEMAAQETAPQAAPIPNEAHPVDPETGEIVSQERANLRHQAERRDTDTKTLEELKALSTKELLGRLKNVEQYERVYGLDERSSRFRRKIGEILAGRGEAQTDTRNTPEQKAHDLEEAIKQNIARGKRAMHHTIDGKRDVINAMYSTVRLADGSEIGWVDFLWGRAEKTEEGSAFGIAHIISERQRRSSFSEENVRNFLVNSVPEVIARGTVNYNRSNPNTFRLELGRRYVILSKNPDRNAYVITAYGELPSGGQAAVSDTNLPTQDTATRSHRELGADDNLGPTVPQDTSSVKENDSAQNGDERYQRGSSATPRQGSLTRGQVVNTANFALKSTSDGARLVDPETEEIVSQERANLRHQAERGDADTKTLEGLKALSTKELLGRLKNVEQYERAYGLDERSSRFRRWIDGILAGRGVQETMAENAQRRTQNAEAEPVVFSRNTGADMDIDYARIRQFLDGEPVSKLSGNEFANDGVPLTQKVPKWYADNGYSTVDVPGIGRVSLDERAVSNSIGHGIGRKKAIAFAAVPNVLIRGIIVHQEPMKGAPKGSMVYHIAAPVSIGSTPHIVDVLVRSDQNTQRMYVHEVVLREELQSLAFKTSVGAPINAEQPSGASDGVIRSVLQHIYSVNIDGTPSRTEKVSVPQDAPSVKGNDSAQDGEERYQRGDSATPRQSSLIRGQVVNTINFTLKGMKRVPSVVVVNRVADLPFGAPAAARGAYRDGTVYVVMENAASIEGVKETVFHEVRGHFGLRGFFGKGLDNALIGINNANPRIRGLADTWIAANQDVVSNLKSRYGWTDRDVRALAIEEAMAQMAESGQTISGIQRFAAAVQSLLRKMGMGRLANMLEARTDAEAMRLLAQADLFLQTGETVESRSSREAEAAQAYSRDTGHINPDYGKEVDDIKSGRRIRPAVLGMPSNMLLRSGIPNHPLIITKGTIEKDMVGRHNLTLEQIKRLPYRLGYPLMVFKSSDVNNPDRSVALINDAEKYPDGREEPIVVAIEPNGRVERIRVNEIKSAYGKENIGTALTNWTREGLLVSAQKKIAERWLTTRGLQLPNVVQAINSDSTVNLSEPDPSSQEKNTPPLFSRMGDDAVPDRVLALQSESLKDDFIRAIMNDKIGLKRLQEAIRDTKDVLTDGSNTYAMPVSHRANTPGGIGRGPLAGWL